MPLVKLHTFTVSSTSPFSSSVVLMPEIFVLEPFSSKSSTNWVHVFYIIYGLGVIYMSSRFANYLLSILNYIVKNAENSTNLHGYKVIGTHGKIPTSSFFNYILWDNTPLLSPEEQVQILKHEQVHVTEKHSIDIVLINLFQIFFWFNPIMWYIRKSMTEIHEFMADLKAYDTLNGYKKLLAKQALSQQDITFTHAFKSSDIQKRIKMLDGKHKATPYYSYATVAFIFMFMVITMSFDIERNNYLDKDDMDANKAFVLEESDNVSNEIFTIVEKPARPKDGMDSFYEYISSTLEYPSNAVAKKIEGRVYVEFIIEKNGAISNAKVLKGIDPECDANALKTILSGAKWNPAMHNGKVVKQKIVIPITFKVS
ncbi:MAG: M56 family metallopeptidase [Cyclobacteriaceae bacterium]|nr:M56 family metallopeptidase [Cyclobacteriaceae bacterium]